MHVLIEQQSHGYKNGHQLLATSVRLARGDQDVVDRLSDISGPLRPGETFDPYLTAYPLPSGNFYVLARTWQDLKAARAGCVLTRSLLVPMGVWEAIEFPVSLIENLVPVTDEKPRSSPSRSIHIRFDFRESHQEDHRASRGSFSRESKADCFVRRNRFDVDFGTIAQCLLARHEESVQPLHSGIVSA